jgi:hypothetical protein
MLIASSLQKTFALHSIPIYRFPWALTLANFEVTERTSACEGFSDVAQSECIANASLFVTNRG